MRRTPRLVQLRERGQSGFGQQGKGKRRRARHRRDRLRRDARNENAVRAGARVVSRASDRLRDGHVALRQLAQVDVGPCVDEDAGLSLYRFDLCRQQFGRPVTVLEIDSGRTHGRELRREDRDLAGIAGISGFHVDRDRHVRARAKDRRDCREQRLARQGVAVGETARPRETRTRRRDRGRAGGDEQHCGRGIPRVGKNEHARLGVQGSKRRNVVHGCLPLYPRDGGTPVGRVSRSRSISVRLRPKPQR